MCMPKAPKITQTVAAPDPVYQSEKAPTQASILVNSNAQARRRQGYAALIHTPVAGLAAASTTANFNLPSAKTTLGG